MTTRTPDHAIEPLFADRSSPRHFTSEAIDYATLSRLFEAARWAPSASNAQPWRFVVVKRDAPGWPAALALLNPRNQDWARTAAALIFVASSQVITGADGPSPSRSHAFDTGAAWAQLALQAHLLGWGVHAMGGFDREAALGHFHAPADTRFEAAVAIGRPEASPEARPPSQRRPIADFVFSDRFPAETAS